MEIISQGVRIETLNRPRKGEVGDGLRLCPAIWGVKAQISFVDFS